MRRGVVWFGVFVCCEAKAAVGMEGGDPNSVNNLKRPTDWLVSLDRWICMSLDLWICSIGVYYLGIWQAFAITVQGVEICMGLIFLRRVAS